MVNVKRIQMLVKQIWDIFSTKIDLLNRDHEKNGIQDLMKNKYISWF